MYRDVKISGGAGWGEGKVRVMRGVKSLPWLILADEEGIVRLEGFGLNEKIKEAEDAES